MSDITYNLSQDQLPIKPSPEFIDKIHQQLNFLRSFQNSPSAGFPSLRKKLITEFAKSRGMEESETMDCVLSNGSILYNALGAVLKPGAEVILLAPYCNAYPQAVEFWGGVPVLVRSNVFDAFVPAIDDIRKSITEKTAAIIVNSPNNPCGIHYSESWMIEFAELMSEFPALIAISDEVYSDLSYFDPRPSYFYKRLGHSPLLERTIVVQANAFLGWAIATENIATEMAKLNTAPPNSLMQRAMMEYDFANNESFLAPVRSHVRQNAAILREKFREAGLGHCWYQSTSAFFFMIDFSRTPMFQRFDGEKDNSCEIAEELLNVEGITVVPGSEFGLTNSARISLVIEEVVFAEAIGKICKYLRTSQSSPS